MQASSSSSSASPPQAIPVTVVTGFLGSGKTTLLSGLVQRRQTRRLALLINEFGDVAIDGMLMRDVAADAQGHVQVQDFADGLIAYGGDEQFIPAMQAIAARRAGIDHVLIETSGLALPTAVMELLQGPALAGAFVLDATLAVVDTPLLLTGHFEAAGGAADQAIADLFAQQLEFADLVVLNKIDALDDAALLAAEAQVRQRAPNVRFLELAHGARLDVRVALGLRLHQAAAGAAHRHTQLSYAPLADQGKFNGHAHSGLAAHSHGLATHKHFHEQDPGWLSFTLRSAQAQQAADVQRAVFALAGQSPLLRCKGFLRSADGAPLLLQAVRDRVAVTPSADTALAGKSGGELVFIGYHLQRTQVAALLSELTATEWK